MYKKITLIHFSLQLKHYFGIPLLFILALYPTLSNANTLQRPLPNPSASTTEEKDTSPTLTPEIPANTALLIEAAPENCSDAFSSAMEIYTRKQMELNLQKSILNTVNLMKGHNGNLEDPVFKKLATEFLTASQIFKNTQTNTEQGSDKDLNLDENYLKIVADTYKSVLSNPVFQIALTKSISRTLRKDHRFNGNLNQFREKLKATLN